MHRRTIAIAATAALAGGASLAVAAQGQDQPPRTLTFTLKPPARRDTKQIDVRPHGISAGDRFLGAQTVRLGGNRIGRVMLDCTALDGTYRGQACAITLVTRNGQLTAQGGGEDRRLPGHGGNGHPGDVFAVTGGTDRYAGAAGTMQVRSTRSGGGTITVTLIR